eukprot:CAMPEP_0184016524 /NCGR_PEP_ID=MMETSP0954-20121128/6976_1 /TAXON_ID=627963 /ORGANISM="Aplanochytrium sp, Strain PBS07" /LENGTH=364 /DNA_ID=CAMNT_0026297553 /DNA_START=216 /DNA_END=1307 /DNA_ORIENTATION=-
MKEHKIGILTVGIVLVFLGFFRAVFTSKEGLRMLNLKTSVENVNTGEEKTSTALTEVDLNDENIFEVPPPHHLFNDRIVFTSVICDHDGSCNTTGLVKRDVDFRFKIKHACFKHDDRVVPFELQSLKYVIHKKKNVKVYAANGFFKLTDLDRENPVYPNILQVECGHETTNVPVLLRRVRTFDNKIVLLVTQYYSYVDLKWVKIWMKHYFDIGVDIIALYAGFHTENSPEAVAYTSSFNEMVDYHFPGKVMFFKWDSIAELQTWAHSQASMINHGQQYFKGSVIMGADLDELVLPLFKPNLKEFVKYYDDKYGSWALQWHSYIVNGLKPDLKQYILNHSLSGDLDFNRYIDTAHPCGGSPSAPW